MPRKTRRIDNDPNFIWFNEWSYPGVIHHERRDMVRTLMIDEQFKDKDNRNWDQFNTIILSKDDSEYYINVEEAYYMLYNDSRNVPQYNIIDGNMRVMAYQSSLIYYLSESGIYKYKERII